MAPLAVLAVPADLLAAPWRRECDFDLQVEGRLAGWAGSAAAGGERLSVQGRGLVEPALIDSVRVFDQFTGDKAEALKAKFPALADIRVRRNWTENTATLTLVVRRAVASATRRGKAAGFLGDDGTVFAAPEGAFMPTGPSVEVSGASAAELSALAREWPVLAASGPFPAELTGMAYSSPEDGWEATLADGTKVLWGRLEWTREKLSRLSEAVADARA